MYEYFLDDDSQSGTKKNDGDVAGYTIGVGSRSCLETDPPESLHYNENTFILSLRTMRYIMRRPPKSWEDYVAGKFCNQTHDTRVTCTAYIDGAQVGCLTIGGVQDVDQRDKSYSNQGILIELQVKLKCLFFFPPSCLVDVIGKD
ncbi:hypothetical protein V8G54_019788 [Vigna mungo]|uniref:Uncharacterized protein n=1 Tax=Vigna mungo TaxID=3915 RepID=A0AAQ3NCC3_VIGMU